MSVRMNPGQMDTAATLCGAGNLVDHLIEGIRTARRDVHGGARRAEPSRDATTETPACAGHNDHVGARRPFRPGHVQSFLADTAQELII
jgi:hypothetical protein